MLRDRRTRTDEREVDDERPLQRALPPILQLQQGAGNQAVARMLAPQPQRALARTIAIGPTAYLSGIGATDQTVTGAQLDRYIDMAVLDELRHLARQPGADPVAWKVVFDRVKDATLAMPLRMAALRELVITLDTFEAGLQTRKPAHSTRYATEPAKGYTHGAGGPKWGTDEKMREVFAPAFGAISGGLNETQPADANRRGKDDRRPEEKAKPLKQIPFDQALTLFPKPLMNLIFDVRLQLETGGATIVDERTEDDREHRRTTQSEGGSLRSYHQDSAGVLPPSGFEKAKEENPSQRKARVRRGDPAPAPDNVPAGARRLHDHYQATSTSGAGSSIQAGRTTPEGLAEYTGTGTNTEHNTKVVLDYLNKRVYVTLSHYQYWALIDQGGTPTHWQSKGQSLSLAQAELSDHLTKLKLPATAATMMSPWVEVLSPT